MSPRWLRWHGAEVAVSNAFYYRKAARENVLKISETLIKDGKIEAAEVLRNVLNQ